MATGTSAYLAPSPESSQRGAEPWVWEECSTPAEWNVPIDISPIARACANSI
jgi:hypothetical protein